jgi:hypothetical protein
LLNSGFFTLTGTDSTLLTAGTGKQIFVYGIGRPYSAGASSNAVAFSTNLCGTVTQVYVDTSVYVPGYTVVTGKSTTTYPATYNTVLHVARGEFMPKPIGLVQGESLLARDVSGTGAIIYLEWMEQDAVSGDVFLPVPAGGWTSTAFYKRNSVVHHTDNSKYLALVDNTNVIPGTDAATWQLVNVNVGLLSSISNLLVNNGVSLNTTKKDGVLYVSGTLVDKTFTGASLGASGVGSIAASDTAFSYLLPSATSTLVCSGATQTLTAKTFTSPAIGGAITLSTAVTVPCLKSLKAVIRPASTFTLTGSTYTLPFNSGVRNVATQNTASQAVTITLPALTAGASFSMFLTMTAASQTITFVGARFTGNPVASTTAGKIDAYYFLCDGTYWYGFLTDKGL